MDPQKTSSDEKLGAVHEDEPQSRSSMLICAAALLTLVTFVLLWSPRNLGIGIKDPGWLAPILTAISAALAKVGEVLRRRERAIMNRKVARLYRSILRPVPITLAYLFFGIITLTRSSISVIAATPDEERNVTVRPLGAPTRNRKATAGREHKPAHFYALPTSPFGRAYRVEAEGYVPAIVNLPPFSGRELRLGRDIPVSPSVLIRPSRMLLGDLQDSARLVVYETKGERRDSVGGSPPGVSAALLLGREQPIPIRPEWTWELAGEDESRRSDALLKWVRPTVQVPNVTLNPGSRLEVVVFSKHRHRLATMSFTVRNDPLMDVPLH